MDMKRILQAVDGIATKPVEGGNDMKKFLQVVTEGANPHKVTLPVQMAMQHYSEVKTAAPKPIREVKRTAMSSLLQQYVVNAEEEILEDKAIRKEIISEQARRIADRVLAKESRVDELSKNTLKSYVKANKEDTVQRVSSDSFKSGAKGDKYNTADETHKDKMREKGMERALNKLTKEGIDAEGGMAREQLISMAHHALELAKHLEPDTQLDAWVQTKIGLASDYIQTVSDFVKYGHQDVND
jgi:hypothetical protein